ncbi:MAG: winged helix-turn-helix transcriptional regulator [Planctomycetes bacterium]|nr:winged helix-turn-helix transcriptional regulator [Planctomycetota bacterium]
MKKQSGNYACPPKPCPVKPSIKKRPLIERGEAGELAGVFKVLANDTRLRILHALARDGEMPVSALAEEVGMKPQGISNQLQRLVDRGILCNRRDGNSIRYCIMDPCIIDLLERGLCLMEDSKDRHK